MPYDVIVRNGLWFDGTGARPHGRTLGIRDGVVAGSSGRRRSTRPAAPTSSTPTGKWVMPGFIDVHTHYDAELLLDPGSRRVGAARRHHRLRSAAARCRRSYADAEDCRRPVHPRRGHAAQARAAAAARQEDWTTPARVRQTLDASRSGPNVTSFLGHSDLRTRVHGARARRPPTGVGRPTPSSSGWSAARRRARRRPPRACPRWTHPWDKLDGDRFRSRAAAVDVRDAGGVPRG